MDTNIRSVFKQRIEQCFMALTGAIPIYRLRIIDTDTVDYAGIATEGGEITLNMLYYRIDPEYFVKELIGHEVCHVVCFKKFPEAKQCHGKEFRELMRSIGLVGNTYLPDHMVNQTLRDQQMARRPYVYACACKEYDITDRMHKSMTLEPRKCLKCKTTLKALFKRVYTESK